MTDQSTPTIQKTTDYSKFKLMTGNRAVDYNHVKQLKKEMQTNPQLLASNPILVNEYHFIIDGQHRRQAAQELNLPIYYIESPGITLSETRSLNVTQRRWTLMDFARSYAEAENQDYRQFISMVNKYPKIAPAIIMKVMAGGQKHELGTDFRRGEFKVDDINTATKYLNRFEEVMHKSKTTLNTAMAMALFRLFNDETDGEEHFNYDKFIGKLEHKGAGEIFTVTSTARGCLRSIEDVYNFMSPSRVRLY